MQHKLVVPGERSTINASLVGTPLHDFVKVRAAVSVYYSRAWLDLISELYGYTVIPLTTADAAGQVNGFLPLCLIDSPLTGRRLVALPFSDYCPLLADDQESANGLIDQALGHARERKVKYLELRTGSNEVLAQRPDLFQGDLYVRWLLPLTADPDTAWSGLRGPVQRRIKKSGREGVRVYTAQNREDIARYYRLHVLTRSKKHGMPVQPQRFFYGLWDAFAASGALQLFLAEYQGMTIASAILLRVSDTTVGIAYSASDESYLNLSANNLIIWKAIAWACEQGYQVLDLGRTARDNEGLMEFKRRWGAVMEPLPYYYSPHMAGLAATSESSWKYRLLTNCWKRLPLSIAGPLGGSVYRHLG
jgi:FemAB-related protein (PEP-CTERM system-associated)